MADGTGTAPVPRVPSNRGHGHGRQPYSLVQHCAHLSGLEMAFDATSIPEWDCALATYPPQTMPRYISVAISRIWAAPAVATFISGILPNATVDCYPYDDGHGLEEEEMYGAKQKAKPPQYHLKRDQIPEEHKGLKESIFLHGYILYGVCRSDIAPPLPTPVLLAAFDQRYEPGYLTTLEDKLRRAKKDEDGATAMVTLLRAQATTDQVENSHIAKKILSIGVSFLTGIFSQLLAAGFEQWCPDLLGPPDSVYNQAHEIIFIQTFKSAANSFAYRLLEPTPSGVNNHTLVTDLYRSFIFAYMRAKSKVDTNEPGKLGKTRKTTMRLDAVFGFLAEKRLKYAIEDKLPNRVLGLLTELECHSDDEYTTDAQGNAICIVNAKESRSGSASSFIQQLEVKRIKFARAAKGKKRTAIQERTRVYIPSPPESDISFQLPVKAPIDWFHPDTYNDLPAQTPGLEEMDKAAFMAKYGNDVLNLYNIPTKEEMAEAGNEGYEEDEVDDMMDEEST
ncbi:hypothetical protein DFH09DRAFT_1330144 [Mycena vulgaris]|nr:hypothetical protein DFH09DRAFT_1330144 [Mycena vulgaris]